MSVPCRIAHTSNELAIVCACRQAKCIPCLDRSLYLGIDAENLSWNKCPDCKQPYSRLRVYYSSRTMTEWVNRSVAQVVFQVATRLLVIAPWSYKSCKALIHWTETHFYQAYFTMIFLGALLYSDYCLVGIWAPNAHYLLHRHFCRFDYVIKAKFDRHGPKAEPMSSIGLRLDVYTVLGTLTMSSLIIIFHFSHSSYWVEFMSMAMSAIEF